MPLKIANAAGFWGDRPSAAMQIVARAEVDYLTLEYLAELTLSILARQRAKNPAAGFAHDIVNVIRDTAPALKSQPKLKIVTNAGGVNPLACARAIAIELQAAGLGETNIAVVLGDEITGRLAELQAAGHTLANMETGLPLAELTSTVISANAYLGAESIAAALAQNARIVVTGRVADASLTVGPCLFHFGWRPDDWAKLAGASVAGHLIECGAQVTGGYATTWENLDLCDVGYPIAEVSEDGSCIITKPRGTGGAVNRRTVIEQLVYEIGDPQHYLTPDVDVDFTTVEVHDLGDDRVQVRGAAAEGRPPQYKVSLVYEDGFTAAAQLLVYGPDCLAKADRCGEIIFARLQQAGFSPARTLVEKLGSGDGVPGVMIDEVHRTPPEVVLRIAVWDKNRAAVERFTREIAPLITSGPAGLAGYASGRPEVRPVLAHWPALLPREAIVPIVQVRTANEWSPS